MKKWQIPNVKIEKFTPNEYVSSCSEHTVSFNNEFAPYIDLDSDGLYDSVERATFTGPPYGLDSSVESKGYENIKIYRQGGSNPPDQAYYNGSYFINSYGPYYVYVAQYGTTRRAWIYDSDYRPGSTPTLQQSFS